MIEGIYHCTPSKNWNKIKTEGLKTQGRVHIHFNMPKDKNDGPVRWERRSRADVALFPDVHKCMKAGVQFFLAENGVVVTRGLRGKIDWGIYVSYTA